VFFFFFFYLASFFLFFFFPPVPVMDGENNALTPTKQANRTMDKLQPHS